MKLKNAGFKKNDLVNDWKVEEEFKPYFAWVSDYEHYIKTDSGVSIIVRHANDGKYKYVSITGCRWRCAIPLTVEEIKKYSGGLV